MKHAMVAVSAFVLAFTAGATTFLVDRETGDDAVAAADLTRATRFATIQAALDLTADGDTVRVYPGTYDQGGAVVADVLTRANITKAVTLEAVSPDPSATRIVGKGTDRCVYCGSADAIVRGFTLGDGYGQGGGFCAAKSYSAGGTIVDCVVSNCTGGAGASVYGGRAVRCRIVDGISGAVSVSILVNCLITRVVPGIDPSTGKPVTTGALSSALAYNCTIVDNPGYALRASVTLINSVVMLNKYTSANGDRNLAVTNSVAVPWTNTGSVAPDESTCVTETDEYCFFSPAAGDWRPMAGSVLDGRGDASLLAALDLPDGIDPYVDITGRAFPSKTGAVAAGAFQEVISEEDCSGVTAFDGIVGAEGYQPLVADGYCRTADPNGQVRIKGYPDAGSEVVCFTNPDLLGGALFPEMDESAWIMMPPNGTVTTNVLVTAYPQNVFYVDPVNGSDTNDGSSSATALETLTAAMGKMTSSSGKYVVHAAAGHYTNGCVSTVFSRMQFARTLTRVKGAGIGRSFIYGQRASGTEGRDDGRGPDALRCIYANSPDAIECVQGFTLADGFTDAGGESETTKKGGLIYADKSRLQVTDCELSNGWAARGALAWGGIYKRCIFTAPQVETLEASANGIRAADVVSCVARAGILENAFFANIDVIRHVTFWGNPVTAMSPMDDTITPYDSVVANCQKLASSQTYGCLTDADTVTDRSCTRGSPCFVNAEEGDFRLLTTSPALTCGVLDADYWRNYSSDLGSRPILFIDGKPVAGALQNPVTAVVIDSQERCGVEPSGTNAVEAGGTLVVTGTSGSRPAIDLVVNGEPIGSTTWTCTVPADIRPTAPITVTAIAQTNLYVNADETVGDDDNDGFSPETPKFTLAGVMPLATSGDTVHAAPGCYTGGTFTVAATAPVLARLHITQPNVRVTADEGPERTFIVGAPVPSPELGDYAGYGLGTNATRCVYIDNVKGVRVEGFTLTGGHTLGTRTNGNGLEQGAAVCAENTDAVIAGCIISNNVASWGAAARLGSLVGCRVTDNIAINQRGVSTSTAVYDCFFDNNRVNAATQGMVYDPPAVINCTFGPHNYGKLTGTTTCAPVCISTITCPAKGCAFLGDKPKCTKTGTMNAENCAFATWPTADDKFLGTNDACIRVSADCVAADGRPDRDSPLVDAGANSVTADYAAFMSVDVDGGQRVYNGTIDIGCAEYDWRGAYAATLGGGVTVESASPGVRLADGKVELVDGGALSGTWPAQSAERRARYSLDAEAQGEGTLFGTLVADGKVDESIELTNGAERRKFKATGADIDWSFAFSGDGFGLLSGFVQSVPGKVVILR